MGESTFALVTGASSGIGLELSRELARRGCSLLMVSNEEAKLIEIAAEIETEYKVKTIPLYMDLACRDSAQNLFDYCAANGIIVQILVNNAGIFLFKDITDTPLHRMETMINLHVYTPALLCRLFAEQMIRENRKGYILNMASVSAQMMMPGIALYSATKGFVRIFSRVIRHELFDHGISVTTLNPGAVATGLYNLPPRYLKLGIRLGLIITPRRMARLAIKKMFRRKAEYIPDAFINRLLIVIVKLMPERLLRFIKKKLINH
jgi:short-subunit dehydrogenase